MYGQLHEKQIGPKTFLFAPKGGPKFFSGPPEKKYDKKISSDPILFFDKMIILYDVSCLREKLAQQN